MWSPKYLLGSLQSSQQTYTHQTRNNVMCSDKFKAKIKINLHFTSQVRSLLCNRPPASEGLRPQTPIPGFRPWNAPSSKPLCVEYKKILTLNYALMRHATCKQGKYRRKYSSTEVWDSVSKYVQTYFGTWEKYKLLRHDDPAASRRRGVTSRLSCFFLS